MAMRQSDSPGFRLGTLMRACVLALVLVAGAEAARTAFGSNFHTVTAGRCYRSAQPSPADLRVLAHTLGVRTVVNLRGVCDDEAWYHAERATAAELGLEFVDAGLWSGRQPYVDEFRDLIRALTDHPEPILLHCASGSDRSGFAAAVYLLLHTDTPPEVAACQLGLRFGHNPWGRAACQDRLLATYVAWLAERGLDHRPDAFRHWAMESYRPEAPALAYGPER
jgi:protein tyrosine/serine phosphatase